MTCKRSERNHSVAATIRIALIAVLAVATTGLISHAAFGASDAGVTDFSGARADAIEVGDITSALAVARGTRIEPTALMVFVPPSTGVPKIPTCRSSPEASTV